MNNLNKYKTPRIIAEIGCNHKGEMQIAKDLLQLAKDCKADYGKFQKRHNKELLTADQYEAPHPNPHNSYGNTYGEHREFLEFTQDQHAELKKFAENIGIGYATSVWDVTSALEISELQPDFIKVPSACNNNVEMLKVLRDNYSGDIHISTGMTRKDEIEEFVGFFEAANAGDRIVLYNCTSGYPVPFEDVCLLEINTLYERFGSRVKAIGFSGHHLGIAVDIAAYALGAEWVERHFTKDRTWRGTDHAASLEPPGLSKLIRNLHQTHEALRYKPQEILEIEQVQREKLKNRKG